MTDSTNPQEPTGAERLFGDFAPALVGFTDDVLFGQVWTRHELSPKAPKAIPTGASSVRRSNNCAFQSSSTVSSSTESAPTGSGVMG